MTADELVERMAAASGGEPIRCRLLQPNFEPPEGEPVKAVPMRWFVGDRVRKVGGDPLAWGWVTQITVNPGNAVYGVKWPADDEESHHYAFELDDAG